MPPTSTSALDCKYIRAFSIDSPIDVALSNRKQSIIAMKITNRDDPRFPQDYTCTLYTSTADLYH